MNQYDPTSTETTETSGEESSFREVTVAEVAAMDAMDAANLEPTQPGVATESATRAAALPVPPSLPVPMRPVSGRYRGNTGAFQLELRVDVDRVRPMKRVSGDFLQITGSTTTYFGSFVVASPTITVTSTDVIIKGLGSYTFSAGAPVVKVTLQRRTIAQPPAPAVVQFFTTGGSPGASYTCGFE